MVPRTGTEVKVFFSDSKVFTEVDIGATAATLSRPEIVSISERERLDCWKVLEEVNSSMILLMELLVEFGRTTIRSEPISLTSFLTRLEILPIKERIRIILATPMAIPRQVRKERVRFSLMEVLASLK